MIDHAKLARLTLDLDLKRAELRGFSDLYATAAGQATAHAAEIAGSPFVDMTAAELAAVQIDWHQANSPYGIAESNRRAQLDAARVYRAARDRAGELSRRIELLRVEVDPLARLVDRLTKYAAGSA